MENVLISNKLAFSVINQLSARNSGLNEDSINLIIKNVKWLDTLTLRHFLHALREKNVPLAKYQYKEIIKLGEIKLLKQDVRLCKRHYKKMNTNR
jgi:hypothetical protein